MHPAALRPACWRAFGLAALPARLTVQGLLKALVPLPLRPAAQSSAPPRCSGKIAPLAGASAVHNERKTVVSSLASDTSYR
jgi:hypothetical protein